MPDMFSVADRHAPYDGMNAQLHVLNLFFFRWLIRWLQNLGLAAYVDGFHEQGYTNLFELHEFTLEVRSSHRSALIVRFCSFCHSLASYVVDGIMMPQYMYDLCNIIAIWHRDMMTPSRRVNRPVFTIYNAVSYLCWIKPYDTLLIAHLFSFGLE